jgi:hypothetical protein
LAHELVKACLACGDFDNFGKKKGDQFHFSILELTEKQQRQKNLKK